ncbi:MAG: SDR family oxidoreductase [Bacteroidales bacterium]|nr:SDR family oxidoreductase [Bacteroidales bacterium]
MNLNIRNQNFIVTGTSSGFGKAITEYLISEGAYVFGVARRKELLDELKNKYNNQFDYLALDISRPGSVGQLIDKIKEKEIHGVFVNAGGPPAKMFIETQLSDWDEAYKNLLRWKVDLVQNLLPLFAKNKYGRIVFLESSSVKQPVANLVLSTSLRMSVVGMAKTISQEFAHDGITVNIVAPGSHNTNAIERLITKTCEQKGISYNEARTLFEQNTGLGFMGDASDLASMTVWLLSPLSKFVTGQTISVSGGAITGVFG